ncbi:glycosyltransferase [Effusibacillus pohliae]|uniref:glycosyltransferase n=1 Tax=Effusibacillus pohliae TaxID=232270 RepID=UPI00039B66C3|nr:glycosyltransferase [Effusibacillus pohliae]
MHQPTISLCMIVKNEADHLPRCLQSVKGAVDEIIVVDTGSTDGTAAVARRFGADVFCVSWRDDFAYARNQGVDRASGDWILFLDGDEELDPDDREKLRLCAQHPEFEAFFLQIHNYIGDGSQGATINPVLRLFKNRPEYRFEGRIHEQIAASICRHKPEAAFHITDIKIHHYGYQQETVRKKDKIHRNLKLLQQMLAEKPDDPFTLYNMGVEYLRLASLQQALDAFRKARARLDPVASSYTHLLFKYEIRCLLAVGRLPEAIRLCEEGIGLYPDYTDLHHLKGVCLIQAGQLAAAKSAFSHALTLGPAANCYHTEEGIGTYQTCYTLGLLYEAMRQYDRAIECHMQAIRFKSSVNPPLYRIFRLLKCTNAQPQIPAFIERRFHLKSEAALARIIQILFETDCLQPVPALARRLRNANLRQFKRMAELKCLLLQGDWEAARRMLRQIRSKERNFFQIGLDWLEKGTDAVPKDVLASGEELPFLAKSALQNGRIDAGLQLLDGWRDRLHSPDAYKQWIRTLASLSDFHLEVLGTSAAYHDVVRDARLACPHADGF